MEGKISNSFIPLMNFGAPRWRVSSALDVVVLVFMVWELVAVLDVAEADGCCFLFPVGVDANAFCCFDPRG